MCGRRSSRSTIFKCAKDRDAFECVWTDILFYECVWGQALSLDELVGDSWTFTDNSMGGWGAPPLSPVVSSSIAKCGS